VTSLVRAWGWARSAMTGCWTSSTPSGRFPMPYAAAGERRSLRGCRAFIESTADRSLSRWLKDPKRGRKMPAVKLLHQVSDCNTKPVHHGAFLSVVSVLVSAAATLSPCLCPAHSRRIVFSTVDSGLYQQFPLPGRGSRIAEPVYFVADAYYACRRCLGASKPKAT